MKQSKIIDTTETQCNYFVHVIRRVQVKSVGVSGVKDDEDGVPAAAQNK